MSQTNVFVGSLPVHCNDALLRQCFEGFGAIVSLKVMMDQATGQSRGFGFVQFSDPVAAATAISQMNGAPLDGSTLLVKLADRNAGEKGAVPKLLGGLTALRSPLAAALPAPPPSDNVFVGGIPPEWTEADLNAVFGPCGTIVSSVVLSDKATGRSKGAGLVRFSDVAAAAYAVSSLNGSAVEGTGRVLDVKFADRPQEKGAKQVVRQALQQFRFSPYGKPTAPLALNGPGAMRAADLGGLGIGGASVAMPKRTDIVPDEGANLHIFGLDSSITDLNLYQAFAGYGAIRSVKVISDPATRLPKGYGFVQFFNVQDAQGAMAALNGLQVGGKTWSISVHRKKA